MFRGVLNNIIIIFMIHTASGIKLGLFSGDLTKLSNPLHANRIAHHAPVFININAKPPPLTLPPPLLPAKPPPVPKLPLIMPPVVPPLLPLLPHLPIIPKPLPLLPPHLPLLPRPPILPPSLLTPSLRTGLTGSIIPRTRLGRKLAVQKALNKLKPLKIPIKSSLKSNLELKPNALEKLLDLKKAGSLTSSEFLRFKQMLL